MHDIKRPLIALAASAVLALAGGGTAYANGCDRSGGDSGSYPGDYPASTDTGSGTDDGTNTTSATNSRAARRSRAARLRARHRQHR